MHLVEVPTILFMPHCDMQLYENILKRNWTRDAISNVLLIANRLLDYVDGCVPYILQMQSVILYMTIPHSSNPTHKLETAFPCLLRLGWRTLSFLNLLVLMFFNLAPHLEARPLPTSNLYPAAFNSCSVQFLRRSVLELPFPGAPDRPERC
jgi:hypothetical protein